MFFERPVPSRFRLPWVTVPPDRTAVRRDGAGLCVEMLDEHLDADGDEDDAAQQVGPDFPGNGFSALDAGREPDEGQQEGNPADNQQGIQNFGELRHADAGKRDADGQSVDAGGDGQGQDDLQTLGIEVPVLLLLEGFDNHFGAQKSQDAEGNPVVNVFDEMPEIFRSYPSDERIEPLEEAEGERHRQHGFPLEAFQDDAAGQRHGEAVHGKSHGQNPNFQRCHVCLDFLTDCKVSFLCGRKALPAPRKCFFLSFRPVAPPSPA